MKFPLLAVGLLLSSALLRAGVASPVVDTGQTQSFDARALIAAPAREEAFYGQDAQYPGNPAAYADNGDGTVLDKVTGLTWQKGLSTRRLTWDEAAAAAAEANQAAFAGHADWRVPTIKELDSLVLYAAAEPKPGATSSAGAKPFLDVRFFGFRYGDVLKGESVSDVVTWSSTLLATPPPPDTSATVDKMTKDVPRSAYGINFAEGRLRAYPVDVAASAPVIANGVGPSRRQLAQRAYVRLVRGNLDYGKNRFVDNGDGTVSDLATGLLWQKADSGQPMTWEEALIYAERLSLHGIVRWRLPNAKELESLVDFTRSPDATQSASVDPLFDVTGVTNEAGQPDFPAYWTGTTQSATRPDCAAVVFFGRALARGPGGRLLPGDADGVGARRPDLKIPALAVPGQPPKEGDLFRGMNFVRCVRDIPAK